MASYFSLVNNTTLKALFIVALGLLSYMPLVHAPFIFDDERVIVFNPLLKNLSHGWPGICDVWHFQPSRFLTNLTIALNFQLDQLNVVGYRVVNILIHTATALIVWFFSQEVALRKKLNKNLDWPFWAALLFVVHPLNSEAVGLLSQRTSVLVAFFCCASVLFYLRTQYIAAVVLGVCALLSKETAMTLPLAWVLIDFFIRKKKTPVWVWGGLIMAFILIASFFNWNNYFHARIESQSHRGDILTPWTYLITQPRVLSTLLMQVFAPFHLNLDYDFKMSQQILELETLLHALFWIGLVGVAWVYRKQWWVLSFAVFWFLVSLLTHFFPPRGNVIAEHKMYLTLSLMMPILTHGLASVCSKRIFIGIMTALLCVFAFLTYHRSEKFKDPIQLWQATLEYSPLKARVHLNLGVAYFKEGRFDEALKSYQNAIGLAPEMYKAYVNMASVYNAQGDLAKAMTSIEDVIRLYPDYDKAYFMRGVLCAEQNQDVQAIGDFTKVIAINEKWGEAYKLRGVLYDRSHHDREALADYTRWLYDSPYDLDILKRRSDLYFRIKQYQHALKDYNKIIERSPLAVHYYNRSVLYQILGDRIRMKEDQDKARALGVKL